MYIQASLGGDYQFPDDRVAVSGIYCLSLHPPVEHFNKKVTIRLQHCARVEAEDGDRALSFFTAKETPPHIFQPLPGGSFSETGEATIDVSHFTLFTVLGLRRRPRKYVIHTYYISKQLNRYEAHITVTQKKELVMEVIHVLMPYSA